MIATRKNMSLTPATFSSSHPLQLDFCEPGSFRRTTKNHVHRKSTPYAILLTTTEGYYHIDSGDRSEMISPGQVALIPANITSDFGHHDSPEGVLAAHWLHFRFSLYGLVDFLALFDTPLRLPRQVSTHLIEIITQAYGCKNSRAPEDIARLHSLTTRALELILTVAKRNDAAWRMIEQSRLRPALHYIRQNLATPIDVNILAHIVSLSPSRFHALFSEDFGCSPMRYVKRQRLDAAARLLAGSNAKLAVIAEQTGFADSFHLSHAFKAQFGTSPKIYRNRAMSWSS